jgi:uncharacterized protein (TIGR02246 family)
MNDLMKVGLLFLGLFVASGVSTAEERDLEFDSFVVAYAATWNTHDGDALAAIFTIDADLIMGSLPRIAGRGAISEWWDTYFSRIDECRQGEFKLLSRIDIAPEVRIVNVSSKTFGKDGCGEELETRLARGTWVVVKRDGGWLIAAMRGLPAEGEQRSRPGVDH